MSHDTSFSIRRKILFVDDDPEFLALAGRVFEEMSKGAWEVFLLTQSARALSLLEDQSVDLVVLDVCMPGVDGTQFLHLLARKYPDLPKAVLTGDARPEQRTASLAAGASLFLEKPTSSEGYENVFAALNELALFHDQEGFRGLLRRVGLTDVIQMECLARNSSLLEVATPEVKGRIYIRAGNIIHAEAASARGVEAFNRLLTLRSGNFSIKPFEDPGRHTIDGNWEFLVMEAVRQQDEASADEKATQAQFHRSDPPPALIPLPVSSGQECPEPPRDIHEVMVCTDQAEVFYAWHCPDIGARLALLQFAKKQLQKAGNCLSLGPVEKLEVDGDEGRVVAQFRSDRNVWVRSRPVASAMPSLTMEAESDPPREACA